MCTLGVLCCVCGVVGHWVLVHRCARSVCCAACAASWATALLLTGVLARPLVLCARFPRPLGSCSPVYSLRVFCCVVCPVSWATCLPFSRVRAGCGVLPVPGVAAGRAHVHPDGGYFVACRVCVPSGRAHVNPDGGYSVASRGCVCCRVRTHPSIRRQVLPGTCSRAVVRCVLCALSGSAAPGGRCCLARVRVPWLWPAACLSSLPRGPALVRSSPSGPVALGAPVDFPDAVVPFPTRGAFASGFTGRLRGARGGWPRTGLIVPATGPR